MSFKKFCPKCGKDTEELVENLCTECFLKRKELFEIKKIRVFVCRHCKKLLFGNKWIDFRYAEIGEEIAAHVKTIKELKKPEIVVELEQKSDLDYCALIQIRGYLGKNLVEREKAIDFRVRETTCDSCMKLNSDYREAIIQLRTKTDESLESLFEVTKNLLEREKSKDALSGISKMVEIKNGYDLWIGSKKAASKVVRELSKIFGTRAIVSKKLIGEEKTGERKYRHTFCIKLEK